MKVVMMKILSKEVMLTLEIGGKLQDWDETPKVDLQGGEDKS